MGAYIINVPSTVDRIIYVHVDANGKTAVVSQQMEDLTPYTEPDLEQVRKEAYDKGYDDATAEIGSDEQAIADKAYQKGLSDAWEAARKIAYMYSEERNKIFGENLIQNIHDIYSASEAVEKIRQYEQTQKEEEKSIGAEDVMRQYLDTFCKRNFCTKCLLHTPDFTCGRGYHFLTNNPVSDEEVRRAYAKVVKE